MKILITNDVGAEAAHDVNSADIVISKGEVIKNRHDSRRPMFYKVENYRKDKPEDLRGLEESSVVEQVDLNRQMNRRFDREWMTTPVGDHPYHHVFDLIGKDASKEMFSEVVGVNEKINQKIEQLTAELDRTLNRALEAERIADMWMKKFQGKFTHSIAENKDLKLYFRAIELTLKSFPEIKPLYETTVENLRLKELVSEMKKRRG